MNFELWQVIDRFFKNNDIDGAAAHLESSLRAQSSDRFMPLAEQHFTNAPRSVLEHLNAFIEACSEQFDVAAAYLEMNGFDANYGRWYFDSFAYEEYDEDPGELEWLSDWPSAGWPQLTLTGLENIQNDFRWYMENEIYEKHDYRATEEIAVLLVMVRFVQLIQATINSGKLARPIPILATAHDFDIVGRILPS